MQKERDPMYRKICENSAGCSCEKKNKMIGDMEIICCTQCLHVFQWQKIIIDNISEVPKAEKKPKKVNEPEKSAMEKTESQSDLETAKDAKELQKAFAEIDNITAEINDITAAKRKIAQPEFAVDNLDPFGEDETEEVKLVEGIFVIRDCRIKSKTVIRMICEGSKDKRWALDVESQPEKVAKIAKNPGVIIEKSIKVEYNGFDNEGRPHDPKYLAIVAK